MLRLNNYCGIITVCGWLINFIGHSNEFTTHKNFLFNLYYFVNL
jgi:uncharacterized membrane protein YGL010W